MQRRVRVGLAQINNSFSGANYLPYAAGLLRAHGEATLESPERFDWLMPLYKRIPVEEGVRQLGDADVVGFSLYVWNVRLSLAIAKRLKQERPEVLIVAGGPQVPDRAEAFLRANPFLDVVIHGEGEQTFSDLLAVYPARDWDGLAGISYLDPTGHLVTHPKGARLRELGQVPSPYLGGAFDELMAAHPDDEWLILWETNRGCPFQCTFCDWGSATASKVFQFDMDRLKAELEWFAAKRIEFIFCCDANFGILHRDVEIARTAAAIKERTGYPKALSVQNTKNATERAYLTQKILADAGLNKGVTLSMQSIHLPALESVKRRNIALDTYEELQRRFTRDGVPTYSDLILGLPGETYGSFVDGISTLIENGQHNRIQFNNLSILPNAEMGDPAYQRRFAMELVDSKILNMHGAFEEEDEYGEPEMQVLVVATDTMPRADWRRVRALSWMTALLHFDKLLQIPFIVMHEAAGVSYRELLEGFMQVHAERFPVIAEIRDEFLARAEEVQNGGPEYRFSEDWLGIWWPDDEYMLIRLATEAKLEAFYEEARELLEAKLVEHGLPALVPAIADAVGVNRALVKLPRQQDDLDVALQYNILEVYQDVLRGRRAALERRAETYRVERAGQSWDDWRTWCREVVWWGNKRGAYLYGSRALEKYYAGHH